MQPETVVCRDWQEYKTKIVAHLFPSRIFSRGTFLFRGQSDPKWELKSSYDRWFEAAQLGESKRMPLAQRLLDRFRHELPAVEPGDIPPDEMGVLALAQHYGLPTRLLDWSESPYIAAFFAFADALSRRQARNNVAVWALDTRSYVWGERGVRLLKLASRGNTRLRNQDGRFTLLESMATCLEDHVGGFDADGEWPLYTFVVPAAEGRAALSELDVMGINACRLLPDLQGCALNAQLACLIGLEESASAAQAGP